MQISKEALDFKGQLDNLRKVPNLCMLSCHFVTLFFQVPWRFGLVSWHLSQLAWSVDR